MYNIYLVTKVFFVFTKNKEFQTTTTIKFISVYFFNINACGTQKRCFIGTRLSCILSSRCQHYPSQFSQRGQWMFGEICSSGRIGKVSQTKYGHSGCAFFFLLVHRPALEVCSDSHLDILVHINFALWVTQLHS